MMEFLGIAGIPGGINILGTQLAHTDVMDPVVVLGAQICLGSLPPPCS